MVRVVALPAVAGIVLSACSLDMRGLGAGAAVDEGGTQGAAPDVDATSGVNALEGGASAEEAGGGASNEDGSPTQGGDAATVDAFVAGDTSSEAGTVCDQDGDGYLAMGAACGGTDCCDTDANVHPGQTAFFTKAGACGSFDYDCTGQITEEYGAASCQWNTFSCSGNGFAAPIPSCGEMGTFTSCNLPFYDVFTCAGSNAQQIQACR
jgi:hypothetical protein